MLTPDGNITILVKKAKEENLLNRVRLFNAVLVSAILIFKLYSVAQQVDINKATTKTEE